MSNVVPFQPRQRPERLPINGETGRIFIFSGIRIERLDSDGGMAAETLDVRQAGQGSR